MGHVLDYCKCEKNHNQINIQSNIEIEGSSIHDKSKQSGLCEKYKNEENIISCNLLNLGENIKRINSQISTNDKKHEISDNQLNITKNNDNDKINEITKKISLKKKNKKKMLGQKKITFVLLGDTEVGKSSFAIKFTDNRFEQYYVPSISTEYKSKNIVINKHNYILNFIVIIGGEYDAIKYEKEFSCCDFFLFFYDVTNENSFNQIKNNITKLEKFLEVYEEYDINFPNFCLVGNKYDSETTKKFDKEKVQKLVDIYKLNNYEISVKTAKNVNNFITSLIEVFDKCAYPSKRDKSSDE